MRDVRSDHVDPPAGYVSRVRTCSASGCESSTREGKPYCPDHVELHPYVAGVIATRKDREKELKDLAKNRMIREDSPLFNEVLIHITNYGTKTVERLSRDLMIDVVILKKLVRTLKRKGIINIGRTKRGSTTVSPL